ncbi:hypothetical protein K2173_002818 [Erythroxylum novogranatense]|uniref:Uncharacterized protein n=1 Tax=Erythroxylum novogranatense TaxID=1862640 RepID=A0AAV8SQ22_9ROSI|nr:hypothetical protein K2173_002818 [Erythroxylum novogranatense]
MWFHVNLRFWTYNNNHNNKNTTTTRTPRDHVVLVASFCGSCLLPIRELESVAEELLHEGLVGLDALAKQIADLTDSFFCWDLCGFVNLAMNNENARARGEENLVAILDCLWYIVFYPVVTFLFSCYSIKELKDFSQQTKKREEEERKLLKYKSLAIDASLCSLLMLKMSYMIQPFHQDLVVGLFIVSSMVHKKI